MPLNGRNPFALGNLAGGTVQFQGLTTNLRIVAGGGRYSANDILLDGVDDNLRNYAGSVGRAGLAYTPSVDAVEEFKVKTNNFSAEYGHSAGYVMNATIKSGTNEFHGHAWEFLRNDVLDANNFVSNYAGQPKAKFRQNQFGATVGGPMLLPRFNGRDRTFFFVDYEGTQIRQAAGSSLLDEPPAAFRAGDFEGIKPYWSQIKACYEAKKAQGNIYSTMGAHIAMVRLAATFKDETLRQAAWNQLSNHLHTGLGFQGDPAIQTDEGRMSPIERNTVRLYLRNNNGGLYWSKQNGSIYRGMMFLSISPEIGRYLAENVREEILKRHAHGKSRFPLWWLVDAPYFQRDYTGDEGVGLVQPEMMGMIFPIERWVAGADASTLAGYIASAPSCRGDCVWIESLIQTIEAFGKTRWTDVRDR